MSCKNKFFKKEGSTINFHNDFLNYTFYMISIIVFTVCESQSPRQTEKSLKNGKVGHIAVNERSFFGFSYFLLLSVLMLFMIKGSSFSLPTTGIQKGSLPSDFNSGFTVQMNRGKISVFISSLIWKQQEKALVFLLWPTAIVNRASLSDSVNMMLI